MREYRKTTTMRVRRKWKEPEMSVYCSFESPSQLMLQKNVFLSTGKYLEQEQRHESGIQKLHW